MYTFLPEGRFVTVGKRVLIVNSVCGTGSTGRIVAGIAKQYREKGDTVRIAYGRGDVPDACKKYALRIGNDLDVRLHGVSTRILDNHGFGSRLVTKRFLRWADSFDPDVLWLHNIHGYYINIEELFLWIKCRPEMEVRWTLHDCWAFTGHCAHFTVAGCEKWRTRCRDCQQSRAYPASWLLDRSKRNFEQKKELFCGVENLTLVTPSHWLAGLVKESFLKKYPVRVIPNEIDRAVFKPTDGDFRKKYGLEGKQVVLGVAAAWGRNKGLDDFIKLSKMLDNSYRIVLVGLTDEQCRAVPKRILAMPKTDSPRELAEIYTTADVFFNLTYEDNYPTVNLEAEACGTRVVTYDTGGCRETVHRKDSRVVPVGDIRTLLLDLGIVGSHKYGGARAYAPGGGR